MLIHPGKRLSVAASSSHRPDMPRLQGRYFVESSSHFNREMKNALQNLFLFVAMAIVFSGLTGCGGPTANNSANSGTNAAGTNTNTKAPTTNAGDFPPLKSALADGEIEMMDGTKTKLSDRKGKVLLVNLWATW